MENERAFCVEAIETRPRAAVFAAAVLPSFALYAALTLALGELFGVSSRLLAWLPGLGILVLCGLTRKPVVPWLSLAFALCAGLLLLLLPGLRAGGMTYANRLFTRSEAVNAYAYTYFAGSAENASALAGALLCASIFLGGVCAVAGNSRVFSLLLFLAMALFEGYFGVTPTLWKNLLLFAAFMLLLLKGGSRRNASAALLAFAGVAVCVLILAPRPNAAVEAYSEELRDTLGFAEMRLAQTPPPTTGELNLTHRESRLHEEAAKEVPSSEQAQRQFERETEEEKEISLPHRIDWLRIILLLLAVIALLIIPFAPFLLLSRAKRLSAARRAAFAEEDNAAAIRAMFRHTVNWLQACGMETENRPFAQCGEAAGRLISPEYSARYAEAARIWEEAAYSGHTMGAEQRQLVKELMEDTERTLYASSGRKTRLRLKYAACLCEV